MHPPAIGEGRAISDRGPLDHVNRLTLEREPIGDRKADHTCTYDDGVLLAGARQRAHLSLHQFHVSSRTLRELRLAAAAPHREPTSTEGKAIALVAVARIPHAHLALRHKSSLV